MPPGWKNRGRAPAGFDFALDAMIVCFFYPLLLIIYHAAGCGVSAWLLPLPFAALAALSTLVRRAARGTVVFLPVQAALTAAAGAVCVLISSGHIAAAVFACILCLISSIITTVKYTHRLAELDENRRDPTSPPSNLYAGGWLLALGCVFFYAAFILTIALDLPAYRAADVVCCSVFLIVYFIYSHLSGSQSVLSGAGAVSFGESGASSLRRLGRRFALAAIFAVPALSAVVYIIYDVTGLVRVDKAFISLLSPNGTASYASAPAAAQAASGGYTDRLKEMAGKSRPMNPAVLYALNVILCVIAAAVALAVAYMIFRQLREFFSLRRQPGEIRRSVFAVREAGAKKLQSGGARGFFAALRGSSNNIRIRRLYRRFVAKSPGGEKIRESDAPADILEKIGRSSPSEQATAIYERARYGAGESAPDAVGRMKKLTSRHADAGK